MVRSKPSAQSNRKAQLDDKAELIEETVTVAPTSLFSIGELKAKAIALTKLSTRRATATDGCYGASAQPPVELAEGSRRGDRIIVAVWNNRHPPLHSEARQKTKCKSLRR
jgi:hypothetical protein